MRSPSGDPKVIYLEPPCCVDPTYGRTWCENDRFECEGGNEATQYIRADLVEKLKEGVKI